MIEDAGREREREFDISNFSHWYGFLTNWEISQKYGAFHNPPSAPPSDLLRPRVQLLLHLPRHFVEEPIKDLELFLFSVGNPSEKTAKMKVKHVLLNAYQQKRECCMGLKRSSTGEHENQQRWKFFYVWIALKLQGSKLRINMGALSISKGLNLEKWYECR